jgi:hypothetical protein
VEKKFTLNKSYFNEKHNGLALLTGKVNNINNIIVIDIDNIEHWKKFLDDNDREEPDTVKVISGSGGTHLYFKYTDELESVKSKTQCFGKNYAIDIRTNGGCIIAPPTKYFNNDVEYIWDQNIFDNEIQKMPTWMKKLLLNTQSNSSIKNNDDVQKKPTKKKSSVKIKKIKSDDNEEKLQENCDLVKFEIPKKRIKRK